MTGTTIQLVNGIVLLFTFFSCRIIWGSYQSVKVFSDIYHAYNAGPVTLSDPQFGKLNNSTIVGNAGFKNNILRYAEGSTIPIWLASAYLVSNLILNSLNWFWFSKMIQTLRSRFEPPFGTKRPETTERKEIPEDERVLIEGIHVSTPAARESDAKDYINTAPASVKLEKSRSGTHLEVNQSEVRSRTSTKRRG